ncbi:MAG: (2Fe-2S) ferredoxin domain-containing protein, partial [Spirochaetota bacterium]
MNRRLTSPEEFHTFAQHAGETFTHSCDKPSVRICTGASCIASGALELKTECERIINDRHLAVQVYETGCMGPCSRGPVIKVLPDDVLYQN